MTEPVFEAVRTMLGVRRYGPVSFAIMSSGARIETPLPHKPIDESLLMTHPRSGRRLCSGGAAFHDAALGAGGRHERRRSHRDL